MTAAMSHAEPYAGNDPAWPEGVYGNVVLSEESGDLSGFEVRFFRESGKQIAEFVLCEGWCNRAYHSEVTRVGNAFHFSHIEEWIGGGADGAVPQSSHLVEYSVVQSDNGLRYRMSFDGLPIDPGEDMVPLARLAQPFGLAIAKEND